MRRTQSEIVVPVWVNDKSVIVGVLDVDSDFKAAFTDEDRDGLEAVCKLLGDHGFKAASKPHLGLEDTTDEDE